MARRLILMFGVAALCVGMIGCASQRERKMKEYRKMHETLKSTPDQPPGIWERVKQE